MAPARIVVIGTGALTCACVEAVRRASPTTVEAIEVEAHGISFLEALCRRLGVPYRRTLLKQELSNFFAAFSDRTLVISAFSQYIFPAAVLANPVLDVINFHNSLLPRHRGRNACTWAIYEGDDRTGVTWHRVTTAIDAGEVVSETAVNIAPHHTALDLTRLCFKQGAADFEQILPGLLRGEYRSTPQRSDVAATLHLSTDVPNDGVFDTDWPIEKMSAFLRSLDYGSHRVFPDPVLKWQDGTFTVAAYRLSTEDPGPGGPRMTFANHSLTIRERGIRLEIDLEH